MRIVFLGWGSLVWNPEQLKTDGSWRTDGPLLPVEFARVSRDGRLTLVLYPGAPALPVCWVRAKAQTVEAAHEDLRVREGRTRAEYIGTLPPRAGQPSDDVTRTIDRWRRQQGIDAVVWTALPSNFEEHTSQPLTGEHAIRYLHSLPGPQRRVAEEYIRRAPRQIQTPIRQAIELRLGWTAIT